MFNFVLGSVVLLVFFFYVVRRKEEYNGKDLEYYMYIQIVLFVICYGVQIEFGDFFF